MKLFCQKMRGWRSFKIREFTVPLLLWKADALGACDVLYDELFYLHQEIVLCTLSLNIGGTIALNTVHAPVFTSVREYYFTIILDSVRFYNWRNLVGAAAPVSMVYMENKAPENISISFVTFSTRLCKGA